MPNAHTHTYTHTHTHTHTKTQYKTFEQNSCLLIKQDADAVLLFFKRQMLGLLFDEQIVATIPR